MNFATNIKNINVEIGTQKLKQNNFITHCYNKYLRVISIWQFHNSRYFIINSVQKDVIGEHSNTTLH